MSVAKVTFQGAHLSGKKRCDSLERVTWHMGAEGSVSGILGWLCRELLALILQNLDEDEALGSEVPTVHPRRFQAQRLTALEPGFEGPARQA